MNRGKQRLPLLNIQNKNKTDPNKSFKQSNKISDQNGKIIFI